MNGEHVKNFKFEKIKFKTLKEATFPCRIVFQQVNCICCVSTLGKKGGKGVEIFSASGLFKKEYRFKRGSIYRGTGWILRAIGVLRESHEMLSYVTKKKVFYEYDKKL